MGTVSKQTNVKCELYSKFARGIWNRQRLDGKRHGFISGVGLLVELITKQVSKEFFSALGYRRAEP